MMGLNAARRRNWDNNVTTRKIFNKACGANGVSSAGPAKSAAARARCVRLSLAGMATALGAASGLFGAAAYAQQAAPVQARPASGAGAQVAAQAGQAAPPRCDANCVRANAARAAEACAPRIEAEAPSDFEWLSRPTPGIFQQADPSSPSDSIVRFRGDSIRFVTTDKSWVRVSYECGYDIAAQSVAFVHVRSGRLDQPLAPSAAPSATGTSPKPAAAAAAMLAPPTAGSAQQAAAAPRPRPHVGEPSPVEIQQESANPKSP